MSVLEDTKWLTYQGYNRQRISDEEIAYIQEWAASGNGLRWFEPGELLPVRASVYGKRSMPIGEYCLNAAGMTIAALADEVEILRMEITKIKEKRNDT